MDLNRELWARQGGLKRSCTIEKIVESNAMTKVRKQILSLPCLITPIVAQMSLFSTTSLYQIRHFNLFQSNRSNLCINAW